MVATPDLSEFRSPTPRMRVERLHLPNADYKLTLGDLIAAGDYSKDRTDPRIALPGKFRIIERAHSPFSDKILLVCFAKIMTYDQVIEEFDRAVFRSAALPELLMVGAKHPAAQLEGQIIALDSLYQDPVEGRFAPALASFDGRRSLFAARISERGWGSNVRFAAVALN